MASSTKTRIREVDPADGNDGGRIKQTDPAGGDIYAEVREELAAARREQARWHNKSLDSSHARLLGRLRRGDLTVTASDLATAAHEAEFAKAVADYHRSEITRIESTGPFEPTMAEVIAEFAGQVLGVPATVVDAIPQEGESVEPVAYVRQAAFTVPDYATGTVACKELEVVFRRSALHRRANWDALEAALVSARVDAQVASRSGKGDGEDRAEVVVKSAYLPVMELTPASVSDFTARLFADDLAHQTVQQLGQERYIDKVGEVRARDLAKSGRHTMKATRTQLGDVLTTEVTGTLRIEPGHDSLHPANVLSHVRAAAEHMVAQKWPADRIGRLVSLDVRQDKATGDVFVASIKAVFTAKAADPTFVGDDLEEGDDDE